MTTSAARLREHLGEINDINRAAGVLSWDQQTHMPPGGGAQRAQVLSTLSRLSHAKFTSEETARLLDAADTEVGSLPEDHDDRCLVRITRRDYERARTLPTEFVAAWTRDRSIATEVWRRARPANDFAAFQPHLEQMVEYSRRAAGYFGYQDHPYDALLEGYEPGMTAADVRRVFDVLRAEQVALLQAIARQAEPRTDFLFREYPEDRQGQFGLTVAQAFGYDLQRGRMDTAPHPFASGFGRDDVRITTRYKRTYLGDAIFSIFHEAGHAMYEQNTAASLARTPLARGCSMMFHESQSRLWENLVGRSRPFWEHYFPALQRQFLESLVDVDAETFFRGVNQVKPGLIRVDSDEMTYNLHIMLRFDLELDLITGEVRAADLPGLWREKMQEYLGITPPDDRDGVLQDIHWSSGSFGYFPTYALGNVLSAQIYERAVADRPQIADEMRSGTFTALFTWLAEHVYQHGRKFLPKELVVRVTGRPLDPMPYVAYLKGKFGELYGL